MKTLGMILFEFLAVVKLKWVFRQNQVSKMRQNQIDKKCVINSSEMSEKV